MLRLTSCTSLFLLLSLININHIPATARTLIPPANFHVRLAELEQALMLTIDMVWVLACEKEIHCDTKIFSVELLKLRAQSPPTIQAYYEIAKVLASFVKLPTTELTASEKSSSETLLQETEIIIDALQAHLSTRGINTQHRIFRSVYNKLSPYTHLILMATAPCAVYGMYWMKGAISNTWTQVIPDTHKKISLNQTWSFFETMFVTLFIKEIIKYIDTASAQETLTRAKDYVKGLLASALAVPFKNSNPASSSKINLYDVPLQEERQQLKTVARFMAQQEAILKMGGKYAKGLLISGDTSLAIQAAQGLASEITQYLKISGSKEICTVAILSVSRFITEPFKKQVDRIKHYNSYCVIVIQDLEWLAKINDEVRVTIIADLLSTIKTTLKPYESYIIIGATRDISAIDTLLLQPGYLELHLNLSLFNNRALVDACILRVSQLYNLAIKDPLLYERIAAYTMRTSFDTLKSLFSRTYTKALPQLDIGCHGFNEVALERELSLVEHL